VFGGLPCCRERLERLATGFNPLLEKASLLPYKFSKFGFLRKEKGWSILANGARQSLFHAHYILSFSGLVKPWRLKLGACPRFQELRNLHRSILYFFITLALKMKSGRLNQLVHQIQVPPRHSNVNKNYLIIV
jgi:hypothetical protein